MEGGSLTDLVTTASMSLGQISAVSNKICMGVEHLHRHGFIHGDIRSQNVLLGLHGDVKLSAPILQPKSDHTDPARSRSQVLHTNIGRCEEYVND